jgi:lincosamide nucleotidyltransferase A/C/D/E
MPAEEALTIVNALRAADVRFWICGGWGVDALARQCTRTHRDLDLVIDRKDIQDTVQALRELGYLEWHRTDSDIPLLSRVVLHDREVAGRVIDLHPLESPGAQTEFAIGDIDGCPVPCISLDLQLKTHINYRKRLRERSDLALLRRLSETSVTRLIVPVPSAQGLLQRSAREPGIPAHIAILNQPVATRSVNADLEAALASLLQRFTAFDFTLADVGRLPGVVYVAPKSVAPFVALSRALVDGLPDRQSAAVAHEQIAPHLAVAYGPASIPRRLAGRLPLTARAEEVWLMSRTGDQWVRRAVFRLGEPGTTTAF